MAIVNLTINGRVYEIACEESQAPRIEEMGRLVDARAQSLLTQIGVVPDARLLVMVGLVLADELTEAQSQLRAASGDLSAAAEGDGRLAAGIDALAARIESIADRLERS